VVSIDDSRCAAPCLSEALSHPYSLSRVFIEHIALYNALCGLVPFVAFKKNAAGDGVGIRQSLVDAGHGAGMRVAT
jgi:hypothetical protein